MKLTKDLAEMVVKSQKGRKLQIMKFLKAKGYQVIDDPVKPSYMNLKVMNDDGTMTRIYKTYRGDVEVQIWSPVVMKYSGIPTFEPSGRRSF